MFERFIAGQAILKDNFTRFGYDWPFVPSSPAPRRQFTPSAAYAVDAVTMVFPWESRVGGSLAFVAFQTHELLGGAALLRSQTSSHHSQRPARLRGNWSRRSRRTRHRVQAAPLPKLPLVGHSIAPSISFPPPPAPPPFRL